MEASAATHQTSRRELRRVAGATIIGTTIEWYDFFLYGIAAGPVLSTMFFAPAGPQAAILLSFASVGISFLVRPLGATIAGHFGDRIGRKAMLIWTLLLMGIATALIGVLPTTSQVGILAPILLVSLRVLQGLSTGGEWGGAALMAVEHAPKGQRGGYGSFPQMGTPLGMILASGMLALMTGVISPGAAFLAWGWRIPFLLSIVLVALGYAVRRAVSESPVFRGVVQSEGVQRAPLWLLLKKHWAVVLLAAFVFAANSAAGYMTTGGYIQSYLTQPKSKGGLVGMELTPVLLAVLGSSVVWLIFTGISGRLSDRIKRRPTLILGWLVMLTVIWALFPLANTGNAWCVFLGASLYAAGIGLTYGVISVYYAELFPASYRYSGVSVTYALGAVLGGAFSPLIATALVQSTGTPFSVAWYMFGMQALGLIATLLFRDRTNARLEHDAEDAHVEQPFIWSEKVTAQ